MGRGSISRGDNSRATWVRGLVHRYLGGEGVNKEGGGVIVGLGGSLP